MFAASRQPEQRTRLAIYLGLNAICEGDGFAGEQSYEMMYALTLLFDKRPYGTKGLHMSGNIIQLVPMADAPNRIRELRMEKGWSIAKLAGAINMSKMSVSEIERGKTMLNIHHMRLVSRALGCSPDDLLLAADNPNRTTDEERDLLLRLRAATPETRDQVLKMAGAVLPGAASEPNEEAA